METFGSNPVELSVGEGTSAEIREKCDDENKSRAGSVVQEFAFKAQSLPRYVPPQPQPSSFNNGQLLVAIGGHNNPSVIERQPDDMVEDSSLTLPSNVAIPIGLAQVKEAQLGHNSNPLIPPIIAMK